MKTVELKSYQFRREREAGWLELEGLLDEIQRKGIRSLSERELTRLTTLYRSTMSSLSVARSVSLDRNLLLYLENLALRAYLIVYGIRRDFGSAVRRFLGRSFPQAVRGFRWYIALSALVLTIGIVAGWALTLADADRYYVLVPTGIQQGRGPTTPTEQLRAMLFDEGDGESWLGVFTSFLFTHNAGVGIMAFALGFILGVPVFGLLFTNGLAVGAFGALHQQHGLSLEYWGWVLPHGITELTAMIFCGAGGLVLAHSLVFPGRYSRLRNLARTGRAVAPLVLGAILMFLVASVIEGWFRQSVRITAIRYMVAVGTLIGWLVYFAGAGGGGLRWWTSVARDRNGR